MSADKVDALDLQIALEEKAAAGPVVHSPVAEAHALQVTDQESANMAGRLVGVLHELTDTMKKRHKPVLQSAHALHKLAKSQEKEDVEPLAKADEALRERLKAWHKAEKARREGDADRARIAAPAEDDIDARTRALMAIGMDEDGARKLAEAQLASPGSSAPEPIEVEGITFADNWVAEVEDPKEVMRLVMAGVLPLGLIEFKASELKKLAGSHRNTRTFPGIRIYNEPQVRRKA